MFFNNQDNNNNPNPFLQTGELLRTLGSEYMDCFAVVGFDAETGMPVLVININKDPKAIIALKSMLKDCSSTLDSIMESIASEAIAKHQQKQQGGDNDSPMFGGVPH